MPFHHKGALKWAIGEIRKHRPHYVVQLGDVYDQYCFSKFARNPNIMLPKDELSRGRKAATQMWADIAKASPESKLIQLSGNHDARMRKRIAEQLPELSGVVDTDLLDFPGVTCINDDREYITITLPGSRTKVILTHGWFTRVGAHMAYFNSSVIFGHLHRPSILFEPQPNGKSLFELNAGYLADPHSPVFSYGSTKRKKWQLGYGIVHAGGYPAFISYTGEKAMR